MNTFQYKGGCHCGNVRFNINLHNPIETEEITLCNCSICEKLSYLHLFVNKEDFELTTQIENLTCYQFNQNIAEHYFCSSCGIKSFYQPRSHPDSWSVNVRCLDDFSQLDFNVKNFDGKNWENNIHTIT